MKYLTAMVSISSTFNDSLDVNCCIADQRFEKWLLKQIFVYVIDIYFTSINGIVLCILICLQIYIHRNEKKMEWNMAKCYFIDTFRLNFHISISYFTQEQCQRLTVLKIAWDVVKQTKIIENNTTGSRKQRMIRYTTEN